MNESKLILDNHYTLRKNDKMQDKSLSQRPSFIIISLLKLDSHYKSKKLITKCTTKASLPTFYIHHY